MLADITNTYYRFVPGRQTNRACFFIQRKTIFGWSRVATVWSHEAASDQTELFNGVPPAKTAPYVERTVGGAMLHMNNGYKHFLSLGERIAWAFGRTDAYRLQRKFKEAMARAPKSEADKTG